MSVLSVLKKKPLPSKDFCLKDLKHLKLNLKIAVIDDEGFPEIENFRNGGFSLTHFNDIDSFEQLSDYPIVICDIRGVGKKFGHSSGGAYIIQQLRDLYPEKYLIVASSFSASLSIASLISHADRKITRGNFDELNSAILTAINVMGDSVNRWKRLRNYLIVEKEIDLFHVWELEQEFIKSLNRGNSDSFSKFIDKHAEDIIKGMLINFVSGLVF
ncbi:hypothetical protein [Photobacterium damselae]|uniref:hypothetical protein n=1 Tax=Photobacterium damselae TaxID=38293 RepID=UPI004068CBC6